MHQQNNIFTVKKINLKPEEHSKLGIYRGKYLRQREIESTLKERDEKIRKKNFNVLRTIFNSEANE